MHKEWPQSQDIAGESKWSKYGEKPTLGRQRKAEELVIISTALFLLQRY